MRCFIRSCNNGAVRVTVGPIKIPAPITRLVAFHGAFTRRRGIPLSATSLPRHHHPPTACPVLVVPPVCLPGAQLASLFLKIPRLSKATTLSSTWTGSPCSAVDCTTPLPTAKTRIRTSAACSSPSSSTSDLTTSSSTGPPCRGPTALSLGKLTRAVLRDQLRENALLKKYYCDVNIGDLIKFNEEIAHRLVTEPADLIPLVRPQVCQHICAPLTLL